MFTCNVVFREYAEEFLTEVLLLVQSEFLDVNHIEVLASGYAHCNIARDIFRQFRTHERTFFIGITERSDSHRDCVIAENKCNVILKDFYAHVI